MADHIVTAAQLRQGGIHGPRLAEQLRLKKLFRVLGEVYCDRPLTTADKCRAVGLWREDAVLSHFTAAWLQGFSPEPDVIDAYVSSVPDQPVPSWLRLHVAAYESYACDQVVL
jgi:hypothetical protein